MKKTIFLLGLLSILSILECYSVFSYAKVIVTFSIHDFSEVWQTMMSGIVGLLKSLCLISVYCIVAIHIIRKTNFTNYTRLAYEEFKEKRQEKKANKKANKKARKTEKLEKRLNALKKDTE